MTSPPDASAHRADNWEISAASPRGSSGPQQDAAAPRRALPLREREDRARGQEAVGAADHDVTEAGALVDDARAHAFGDGSDALEGEMPRIEETRVRLDDDRFAEM